MGNENKNSSGVGIESLKTEHSPLPWRISGFEVAAGGSSRMIMAADEFSITYVSERTPEENNANAEFIVRACNSHEALVEALTDLVRQLPNDERLADFNLDRAEAALSLAKEEEE